MADVSDRREGKVGRGTGEGEVTAEWMDWWSLRTTWAYFIKSAFGMIFLGFLLEAHLWFTWVIVLSTD